MSAADENTNAANSMRGGLSALADFLYRQQVQRPLVQAQTKQVGAETDLLGAQTAASKEATGQSAGLYPGMLSAQQFQNRQAKRQVWDQNWVLPSGIENITDPSASPAPGSSALPPVSPFAAQLQTPAPVTPPPATPAPAPPPAPLAPGNPNNGPDLANPFFSNAEGKAVSRQPGPTSASISSRFQGVKPAASVLRPSKTVGDAGYIPGSSQPLQLPAHTPQLFNPSTTAGEPHSGAQAGSAVQSTSPVPPPDLAATAGEPKAPLPPVNPADVSPPAETGLHSLLMNSFFEQPKARQAAILASGHAHAQKQGFDVPDATIISSFERQRAETVPMLTQQSALNANLPLVEYSTKEGGKWARTFSPGGDGGAGGLPMAQYGPVAEAAAKDVANDQPRKDADQQYGSANTVERLAQLAAQAEKTPGGNAGPYDAELLAAAAKGIDPAIRAKLGDAGALKLHSPIRGKIQEALDKYASGAGLPQSARDAFVKAARADSETADQLASESTDRIIASYKHQYGIPNIVPRFSRGGGMPGQRLGNVNPASVRAPGGANAVQVHSQQEYNALAHGTWYSDSNGTVRQKR